MAKRTVALCGDKLIGIETIFTRINGKQINIPEKVKDLREKSKAGELLCPCGCGAHLVLVAGDKNLREQHFRIKEGESSKDCTMMTEGEVSVESKIVLKCWLDDNLNDPELETRVPISDVSDSNRKYEFTFISRQKRVALNYCRDRANLSDEKLKILEDNGKGIAIIHVVDHTNKGTEGQYPEWLMKVQERQRYCLLLEIDGIDYEKAKLEASYYAKDIDGLWKYNVVAENLLEKFTIGPGGVVFYNGTELTLLVDESKRVFEEKNEIIRNQRIEEQKLRKIEEEKKEEERQKAHEEWLKRQEKLEAEAKKAEEEAREIARQKAEKDQLAREAAAQERLRREADFRKNMEEGFIQQETKVYDADGNRWCKCKFCGKIMKESEFVSFGGKGELNLGKCRSCARNNSAAKPED